MRRLIEIGMALTALAVTLPAQKQTEKEPKTKAKVAQKSAARTKTARPSLEARVAKQRADAIRAGAKGKRGEARTAILRESRYARIQIADGSSTT